MGFLGYYIDTYTTKLYFTIRRTKLETKKPFGCDCKHENTTEKIFKYQLSGIEERFVRCDDCDYTVFAGWRLCDSKEE